MEPIAVEKMDFGPCEVHFGADTPVYLGRTQGNTVVEYSVETFALETEEDGQVDEVVSADNLQVTIPLVYTDVDSLSNIVPWGNIVEGAGGEKKLEIPKAVGKRLSDYADQLKIHPVSVADGDLSKDIVIHKCYPKPGPISFTYSRNGTRIANVTFVAMEDENGKYLTIGDPSITSA